MRTIANGATFRRAAARWAVAAFALGCCGSAGSAQDTLLGRCLAIPNINQRVACYDALARAEQAGQPAEQSAEAAPPARAAPQPAAVAPAPRADFGFNAAERERQRPAEQQPLDQADMKVASARVVGPGYWQLAFDDGSLWQLSEVRRAFRPPREGDPAVIRRGALGSYFIDLDGQPAMRIRRLR